MTTDLALGTTDNQRTVHRRYDAYGLQRSGSNELGTDHTFTGQKADGTGLMYYNARYYDPEIGQFISLDSIVPDPTNVFAYNRYMYVYGNPLKYTDPSGHCVFGVDTIVCVATILVGAALFLQTDDTTRELTPEQINSQRLGAGLLFGTAAVWVAGELVDSSNPTVIDDELIGDHNSDIVENAPYEVPTDPQPPHINPRDIAGKTPDEIDTLAKEQGLIPKGPDPKNGKGAYIDPVTGKQRVLSHPNACPPHCHVNNPSGERLDINEEIVPAESIDAHLPINFP